MTAPTERPPADAGVDFLNTLGLVLNLGAVISLALWLGLAGEGSWSLATLGVGTLTVVLFTVSIVCFAVERPNTRAQPHP